jgi:uncharacterized membrane protein YbhN (UPF0104 family)
LNSKRTNLSLLLQLALAAGGALGFHLLLSRYGYSQLWQDLQQLGWRFFLIFISFGPLFFFLSLSWWVLQPRKKDRISLGTTQGITLAVNAWNNLGPISKSMGEPARAYLLAQRVSGKEALKAVALVNLTQSMGTLTAFSLGLVLAPFIFDLRPEVKYWAFYGMGLALFLNALLWRAVMKKPHSRRAPKRPPTGPWWRSIRHWTRWTIHQIRKQTLHYRARFFLSVGFAALARLSEGIAFFAIFWALGYPITMLDAVALDIGRGIADNLFFFIPYQLGTREVSFVFMLKEVLHLDARYAMPASVTFRLGEIAWIGAGLAIYFLLDRRRHRLGSSSR